MKITSKKLIPLALSVVCLNFAGATPSEQRDATQPGGDRDASQITTERDVTQSSGIRDDSKTTTDKTTRYEAKANEGTLAKCNRASGIIGMSVRNQNDEHLGKIKDIVFDLKSDRVAYVVMSASGTGVLGFKEKMVAVPLNAFTTSADEKHLVLRADKGKLDAAAGLDAENWPSASNPSWGAQPFWESDKDATGRQENTDKSNGLTPRQKSDDK